MTWYRNSSLWYQVTQNGDHPKAPERNGPNAIPLRRKPEKVLFGQENIGVVLIEGPWDPGHMHHKECLMVKLRLDSKVGRAVSNAQMSSQLPMTSLLRQRFSRHDYPNIHCVPNGLDNGSCPVSLFSRTVASGGAHQDSLATECPLGWLMSSKDCTELSI